MHEILGDPTPTTIAIHTPHTHTLTAHTHTHTTTRSCLLYNEYNCYVDKVTCKKHQTAVPR